MSKGTFPDEVATQILRKTYMYVSQFDYSNEEQFNSSRDGDVVIMPSVKEAQYLVKNQHQLPTRPVLSAIWQ